MAGRYEARRMLLAADERCALTPVSFVALVDGTVELLLVPEFDDVAYACVLPVDVGAVVVEALRAAAVALLPVVAEDGDPGPLRALLRTEST